MSRCSVPISAFFRLTRVLNGFGMKFGVVITANNGWTDYILDEIVPGTRRQDTIEKFKSTSNRCCHVANDFTNFTVHTACCVRRASESIRHMQRRRHHMTPRGLQLSSLYELRCVYRSLLSHRRQDRSTINVKEIPLTILMGTLQPHSNGPLCSNTAIGTLAVDGWTVTSGTSRRGLGGVQPLPVPSSLYQM